ncbi:MAG TPA: TIGR03435 family protein [Bryobacteraceae bacterium]|nr:TIGR03435 family protein [Bryobacteraceae bacterium]
MILLVLLPLVGMAQPAFQTAEIHGSTAGAIESSGFLPDGRFECRGTSLLKLIAIAYNVNTDAVVGGPDWLGSEQFDVAAKAAVRQSSTAALQVMLQTLLAQRFGLVIHRDRKELSVYLLEVGRKGAKLHKTANPGIPQCPSVDGPPGMNHRACRAYTMGDLARLLPQIARNYVDRAAVDHTGLEGAYDFSLDWMGKPGYLAARDNAEGPGAVSLYDALDKLGLKLVPGTAPSPVIVVDYVNRYPLEYAHSTPLEFEAAEIRPSKPGALPSLTAQNGRLEIRAFTLQKLITMALDTKDDLVTGGPKWLDVDRFDVIAKSTDVTSPHALSAMLKAMIVKRFKLETHQEDQPVTVFALTAGKHAARLEAANGPVHSDCKWSLADGGMTCTCRSTTMAQFAEHLPAMAGAYLNHATIDQTGLEGAYDFTLTWTPKARLSDPAGWRSGSAGLSIFEAIDKQMGLKLEEQKHTMSVYVIDRVERAPVEEP